MPRLGILALLLGAASMPTAVRGDAPVIAVTASMGRAEYVEGEPVQVSVGVRCVGERPVQVAPPHMATGTLLVRVTEEGRDLPEVYREALCLFRGYFPRVTLQPGECLETLLDLTRHFQVARPGRYALEVTFSNEALPPPPDGSSAWQGSGSSEQLEFTVVVATGADAVVRDLTVDDGARTFRACVRDVAGFLGTCGDSRAAAFEAMNAARRNAATDLDGGIAELTGVATKYTSTEFGALAALHAAKLLAEHGRDGEARAALSLARAGVPDGCGHWAELRQRLTATAP